MKPHHCLAVSSVCLRESIQLLLQTDSVMPAIAALQLRHSIAGRCSCADLQGVSVVAVPCLDALRCHVCWQEICPLQDIDELHICLQNMELSGDLDFSH